ncbi:MAG: STAS/SEC14 domain-containing protein [Deltaproteobacteria bacterium]|nr:STAS/SEC14 domain-containing protein [Deltaproteobacteria bacterium]
MMTIDMPRKDKPYAELHVDGKLRAEDYDAMIPKLEQAIAEQGKLRCLVALDDFAGFTPSALADELKFDVRHHDDFERCAIVGDSKLEEIATKLTAPFFSGEVRFFEDAAKARKWLS